MVKKEIEEEISEVKIMKDCFIITPIGAANSETFKKADGLIRSVLKPVLKEHGFNALPAYEIDATGSITKQIIQHIVNDELVIANITGLNPNVMYELAIRHSFKKKVITMAEIGTKLPFDITDQRTIFYEDSLIGSEIVKPLFEKAIIEVLKNDVTSNPIIDSVNEAAILNTIKSTDNQDEKDISKYILERFDRLERGLLNGQYFNSTKPSKDKFYVEGLKTYDINKFDNETKNQFLNDLRLYSVENDIDIESMKIIGDKLIIYYGTPIKVSASNMVSDKIERLNLQYSF